MKVHLAIVENEQGIDVLYCGSSPELARAALVDYCRSWWYNETMDLVAGKHEELSDLEVVEEYFSSVEGERGVVTEESYQE